LVPQKSEPFFVSVVVYGLLSTPQMQIDHKRSTLGRLVLKEGKPILYSLSCITVLCLSIGVFLLIGFQTTSTTLECFRAVSEGRQKPETECTFTSRYWYGLFVSSEATFDPSRDVTNVFVETTSWKGKKEVNPRAVIELTHSKMPKVVFSHDGMTPKKAVENFQEWLAMTVEQEEERQRLELHKEESNNNNNNNNKKPAKRPLIIDLTTKIPFHHLFMHTSLSESTVLLMALITIFPFVLFLLTVLLLLFPWDRLQSYMIVISGSDRSIAFYSTRGPLFLQYSNSEIRFPWKERYSLPIDAFSGQVTVEQCYSRAHNCYDNQWKILLPLRPRTGNNKSKSDSKGEEPVYELPTRYSSEQAAIRARDAIYDMLQTLKKKST
jgi:hypothetical protein